MTATADIVVKKVEKSHAGAEYRASIYATSPAGKEVFNGLISTLLPHPPMSGTQQPEDAASKKQRESGH